MPELGSENHQVNLDQTQGSEAQRKSLIQKTAEFFGRHPRLKVLSPLIALSPAGAGASVLTGDPLPALATTFAGAVGTMVLSAREIMLRLLPNDSKKP